MIYVYIYIYIHTYVPVLDATSYLGSSLSRVGQDDSVPQFFCASLRGASVLVCSSHQDIHW